MADAKKTEADAVVAAPKKNKTKWILIAVIALLALGGGGAAAFFMLKKPPAEGAEAAAAKKKAEPAAPPVFYKFDKPFTVKLATEQQDAYLQAEVQLKLLDATGTDLVKQNEPELKHKITLTLMGRKASMLATSEGVQKLANELRDTINKVVSPTAAGKEKAAEKTAEKKAEAPAAGEAPKPPEKPEPAELADPSAVVQSVLFSSFIIQ
ncbi:MAG: flagellar basal body-associated FliL family protein [Rhodocyclales bacterium]|nr:flagellar basal body-associated FliL family protein [Rhodocyclales bacterium]